MDDLSKINFATDSTISLIVESQLRGNKNYIYLPDNLFIKNNEVYAHTCLVTLDIKDPQNYKLTSTKVSKLSNCAKFNELIQYHRSCRIDQFFSYNLFISFFI